MNSSVLRFPAEYSIALPDEAVENKNLPVILLLHGLGECDEQFKYGVRLERLTRRFNAAFIMPSSRRSCFQDMSHGPKWNTWLKTELLPAVKEHTGVGNGKLLAIGVGTGALGVYALAMTDPNIIGAAINPEENIPFERNAAVFPNEGEWKGIFDGKEDIWEKGLPENSKGLILTGGSFAGRIPAMGWQVQPADTDELEILLEKAVEYCLSR